MKEVRRKDGELCGYVAEHGDRWQALTVFGAVLGEHDGEVAARRCVASEGLASLAERWTLVDATSGAHEIVCIQQASPAQVTLARGVYSMPGVPTTTIPVGDLAAGRWRLERRS